MHYFPQDMIRVNVNKDEKWCHLTSDNDGITFSKLENSSALALQIELSSLNFFAIFLGQLSDPKELCVDDVVMPDSVAEICF